MFNNNACLYILHVTCTTIDRWQLAEVQVTSGLKFRNWKVERGLETQVASSVEEPSVYGTTTSATEPSLMKKWRECHMPQDTHERNYNDTRIKHSK